MPRNDSTTAGVGADAHAGGPLTSDAGLPAGPALADDADLGDDEFDGDLPDPAAPWWVPALGLLIVALGLAVATYLTIAHYNTSTVLACSDNGIVNCQKVTTSAESMIFGIPVAVLGLVFFGVMAVAMLPVMWRQTNPIVRYGRLAFAVTGIGMVVYLVYTELFTLDAICLWCSAVHVLTVLLFAVIVLGTVLTAPAPRLDPADDDITA